MITVTSTFAGTPIVFANSHGPYTVAGGSPVTLSAGPPDPSATYAWDLGDGTVANTPSVTHAYGDDGVYVAKLTVVVTTPGGARTRHFAEIIVTNTTPVVTLSGPDTFEEGDVVTFSGNFTDAEWLDHHTATWDWGDPSPIEAGTVVETHDPPQCTGSVDATHAWGDAGTYLITLTVRDEDGAMGQATKRVTVRNVPPIVHAPRVVYAYPSTVTTLQAAFTDKGWLDRHVGHWDFGDAHGTAIIRESNVPPIGSGTATGSHIYRDLGRYAAMCVVTDDDGASGQDQTILHVVDVRNRHFEDGFRSRLVGDVANQWQPYTIPLQPIGPGQPPPPGQFEATPFSAQSTLFHYGEYAQRMQISPGQRAGLWQRIGANPGWEYQVTAWYSLAQRSDEPGISGFDPEERDTWARPDAALLGLDPTGGTDPNSPAIVWTRGLDRLDWRQLAVGATAQSGTITIFVEGDGGDLVSSDVCFDDVALLPTSQPLTPTHLQQCCTFDQEPLGRVHTPLEQSGFTFSAIDVNLFEIVPLGGSPSGTHTLVIPFQGLHVALPFEATSVVATITIEREETVLTMDAFDATGTKIGTTMTPSEFGTVDVSVSANGITSVFISAEKEGVLLIRICAFQGDPGEKSSGP